MKKAPTMRSRRFAPNFPGSQRGAVLYVAMIMLILMALIGVVGMQVAGLQEKMSANYRNVNMAFQNGEANARGTECYVEALVNRTATTCAPVAIDSICDTGFDATNWAKQRAMNDAAADRVLVRSIGQCISGGTGLGMGREAEKGGDPNPIFQITSYATDFATNPTADAAVDTIFSP